MNSKWPTAEELYGPRQFKNGDKVVLTSRIFENAQTCNGNCANEAMKGSVGRIFTIKNLVRPIVAVVVYRLKIAIGLGAYIGSMPVAISILKRNFLKYKC